MLKYFISLFSVLIFISCQQEVESEASKESMVEHGAYLVEIAGCNDCHTPKKFTPQGPVPDKSLLLSGHPHDAILPELDPTKIGPGNWVRMNDHLTAFVGPWGLSYAANLTPDEQTGIGMWTEENFIQALRTGKHMGIGRPILPPMPWFNLVSAKEEDLKAIFAYLRSIEPVKNLVPSPATLQDLIATY
jgi:mono/diheme cytochrome c family protein